MQLSLPKNYNNKIVKAIAEFDLIKDGDRLLVGLSGGKDSSFLLYALAVLQKYLQIDFELAGVTVNLGFEESNNFSHLQKFCKDLNIPFSIIDTRISEYILKEDGDNPCAKCAHFRRGAIVGFMKENNYNKVAFGHHYDDAVETFLISQIYSGQIKVLQPKRFLSNNRVYIIRPLIYLREKYIVEARKLLNYTPRGNDCPFSGQSRREDIRERFSEIFKNKQLFYNLAGAMRKGRSIELWPPAVSDKVIGEKMRELWGK